MAKCQNAPTEEINLDGSDTSLPKAIRELHPTWITTDKDRVRVELHGGFDHYGVLAFPKGVEGDGTKKLIDGLWYYSD
jgi:hypothetical protein